MINLSNLKPAKGSIKNKFRKGRGQGSGNGLTAGRGHKGAKSRSGYSKKIGFEGGQMPLQRRVPKFGFKNINRKEFVVINLDSIQKLIDNNKIDTILNKNKLYNLGLIKKNDKIKVLSRGDINSKIDIVVDSISISAKNKIESKGGKIELLTTKNN